MMQLEMFAVNIRFLIGLLVAGVLSVAAVIAIWTGLKMLISYAGRKVADDVERRRKFRRDGKPYPPMASGICGACEQTFDKVYYLPDGRRLCARC
jgi:hypothetical protein